VKKNLILAIVAASIFIACKNNEQPYDASGTFESTEIIVSAQAS
jgi:hypothetical protein